MDTSKHDLTVWLVTDNLKIYRIIAFPHSQLHFVSFYGPRKRFLLSNMILDPSFGLDSFEKCRDQYCFESLEEFEEKFFHMASQNPCAQNEAYQKVDSDLAHDCSESGAIVDPPQEDDAMGPEQLHSGSAKTDAEIINIVLASFQKGMYRPGWLARFLLGRRPEIAYVTQMSAAESANTGGRALAKWRITWDSVERLAIDFDFETLTPWKHSHYSFSLPDDSGLGEAGASYGPLCGHGFLYRVKDDGIEDVGSTWIS